MDRSIVYNLYRASDSLDFNSTYLILSANNTSYPYILFHDVLLSYPTFNLQVLWEVD